jgi:hypothetical protein
MPQDIYLSSPAPKGQKVLPNPKNIAPKLDTDPPDPPETTYGQKDDALYRTGPVAHVGSRSLDLGKSAQFTHPLEKHFEQNGVRGPLGKNIPKSSPLISEN